MGNSCFECKEYRAWWNMIARCEYPCADSYESYGKVGITVCSSWRKNFELFHADLGDAPSPNHTLDRIDGTKGYFKGNCRWITPSQQGMNTKLRVDSKVKFKGVSYEEKKKIISS